MKEFCPNLTDVIHALSHIIRCKYDAPYRTWKDIPIEVQNMWFDEFKEKYKKKVMKVSSSQDAPSQLVPPQTQLSIWKETVGLTNKGKVYGFGMEGICVPTSAPLTNNMNITLKITIAQLEKERKSKRKVRKRLNRVEKQLSETTSLLKNLMQHMNYPSSVNANFGSGVGIGVSSVSENDQQCDKEDEDEEEGDDNGVEDV